ncbi:MAG: hypothetical protein KDD82_06270 [Planctomycetes bacterium]|nr:hypothetical protein [Planctomycetota bacterium]
MTWSPWLRLADRNFWYIEQVMWHPICFQFALDAPHVPQGETLTPLYTGVAANEHVLFEACEARASGLEPRWRPELDAGKVLYYRSQARPELSAVEALRDALLAESTPAWNAAGDDWAPA